MKCIQYEWINIFFFSFCSFLKCSNIYMERLYKEYFLQKASTFIKRDMASLLPLLLRAIWLYWVYLKYERCVVMFVDIISFQNFGILNSSKKICNDYNSHWQKISLPLTLSLHWTDIKFTVIRVLFSLDFFISWNWIRISLFLNIFEAREVSDWYIEWPAWQLVKKYSMFKYCWI